MHQEELEYVGFWPRVGASLLDTLLLLVVIYPCLILIYGWSYFDSEDFFAGPADVLINYFFPAIVVILFWLKRQSTPGKDAFSAKVVDAETGEAATLRQYVIRYLGYFVSMIPLFIGIFWVAVDPKKQGWHDKMAGTVVVRKRVLSH